MVGGIEAVVRASQLPEARYRQRRPYLALELVQAGQAMGQQFFAAIFGAKVGDVFFAGSDPMQGIAVARVEAIKPGDPARIAQLIGPLRQQTDQAYLQGVSAAMHDAALAMVKPSSDLTLARAAMGIDQTVLDKVAKSGAKPGDKPSGPAQ